MSTQSAKSLKGKAVADLQAGKTKQALKKAVVGTKKFPKDDDFHGIAGFALTELKQYKNSLVHFAEASRLNPAKVDYVENLANALLHTQQFDRALKYATRKLLDFPANAELTRVIDAVGLGDDDRKKVIDYASTRLRQEPDNIELLTGRAKAYSFLGFEDAGAEDIQRAFELTPNNPDVAFEKAASLRHAGDQTGAKRLLNALLAKDPNHVSALSMLATLVTRDEAEDVLNRVIAASHDIDDMEKSKLAFAEANLASKIHGLTEAMPFFAKANAQQARMQKYDPSKEACIFEKICNLFPAGSGIAPCAEDEAQSDPFPIFIVGQPRSGTTLIELILSGNPKVVGLGELKLANQLADPFIKNETRLTDGAIKDFAKEFRTLMPPLPKDTAAFVDKMPHNYQLVGFLLSAFPEARIVNMLRDPRDVALSTWTRYFPAAGLAQTCDLKAMAHAANQYRRYMAHWNTAFSNQILTVKYEDLVHEPEKTTRHASEFCKIEWHEQMLHPNKNKKHVKTLSVDQVRKAINTRSIGGWRAVETDLSPFIEALDPALWPEYDLS